MQQKQHHGDERQRPAPEHAQDEQVAESSASEEEQVREEMPAEQDAPTVLQADDAFEQEHERRLEGHAVVAVRTGQMVEGALAVSREVIERRLPDLALEPRVRRNAVVVQHNRGHKQEERAHGLQRPVGDDQATEGRRDAHAGTVAMSVATAFAPRRGVSATVTAWAHGPSGGRVYTGHPMPSPPLRGNAAR